MKIDKLDKEIINEIQEKNSCIPKISKIAKKLGKPQTTIYQRIQRLEKQGIITGYSAQIDATKVGKPITCYMLATANVNEDIEKIAEKLCKIPDVQEVHYLTGEWDFLIKSRVSNMEEYYKLSAESVLQTLGLLRSQGSIVPRTFKEDSIVGV